MLGDTPTTEACTLNAKITNRKVVINIDLFFKLTPKYCLIV